MLGRYWPAHPTSLDEGSFTFIKESQHLHSFTMRQTEVVTQWNDVRNLVIACMQSTGVTPQEFDVMMRTCWANIRDDGGPQSKGSTVEPLYGVIAFFFFFGVINRI